MNEALSVLMFAAPVSFAAIGDAIAQRSGVLNIGIEGQMLFGAFTAAIVAQSTGSPYLGIAASAIAGALFALLLGAISIGWNADQVVVGTAGTFVAIGATSTLYRQQFASTGQAITFPKLDNWGLFEPIAILTPIAAIIVALAMAKTWWGLRLRACGERPETLANFGKNPLRVRLAAMILAGALAGIGGGYLAIGVAEAFTENMTQGRGFVAIAMVTFGRWKPIWVLCACLAIGWLESLQFAAQAQGWNVPFQFLLAAPYFVALVVLALFGPGASAPASLGLPYRGPK